MKLCYMNPALLLRRPIAQIIKRMARKHEVGLLIPKPLGKPLDNSLHYSKLPKGVKLYTYSVIQLPGSYEWPIPVTPMFLIQLFRVFWGYDIVHMWAQFYLSNLITCIFAIFFKTRLILTMDTIAGYSFSAGRGYDTLFKWYYRLLGWLIFGAPAVITLYGDSLRPFARAAGVEPNKIQVLPTGIDIPTKPHGNPKSVRREFKIKQEKIILYVGLLVPRKGIDILLKTIAQIRDEPVKVLLVGDGPNREEYQQLARKLKIKNKVVFTGFRKDVFNFYAAADVFFFPSRGEGLPGVVMESQVNKLPVLTSNIPCIPDLIEDGNSGLLCPLGSVSCFKKRLKQLLSDDGLRKRLAENGFKHIQEFEWAKLIPRYERLYEEVAQFVPFM